MLNADAKSEEKKEELVLFLERYYQKGLKEQEVYQAAQLAIALAEEKPKKLGARLVLSSYYNSVLPTGKEKYVSSIYYLYISASQNGKQYLASGPAGYVRELFSDMGISNPQENADQFYAVMFFSTACMMVQITKKW